MLHHGETNNNGREVYYMLGQLSTAVRNLEEAYRGDQEEVTKKITRFHIMAVAALIISVLNLFLPDGTVLEIARVIFNSGG